MSRMKRSRVLSRGLLAGLILFGTWALTVPGLAAAQGGTPDAELQEYPVPAGSHPHDVAPAPDGRGKMDDYLARRMQARADRELGPGATAAEKTARMRETIPERGERVRRNVAAALGRERARDRSQAHSRGYDGLSM